MKMEQPTKVMNKEQIIDEVYQNYVKWWEKFDDSCNLTEEQSSKWLKLIDGGLQWAPFSQEEFINKCKTDTEFSEKWGLQIYTKVDGDKVWMGMVYNDNAVEIRLK
jgi:hypothetical protein